MRLNDLAKLMRTAGDESRLKILCFLFNQDSACVSDIARSLKMNIAIASHHLQVMSEEDLVVSTRDGKKICYKICKKPIIGDLKKFICRYK